MMIAITQYLLKYCVIDKIISLYQPLIENKDLNFFLIVFSSVLVAAGGYIINDYFDVKSDTINRPNSVVVDKIIKRRTAIILHFIFTSIGFFMGVFAALKIGYLRIALFHFFAIFLLWIYSTHLKKNLLIGNFVVSLLTASVAFLPLIFEIAIIKRENSDLILYLKPILSSFKIISIFSIFVFITSMAREIIKDIEDYNGDYETGCKTVPILWGINAAKLIVFFLLNITVILSLFVIYNSIKINHFIFSINNFYIFFALVIPLIFLSYFVIKSTTTKQFKNSSLFLKLIMLLGLFYSFIFYFS